MSSRAWRRRAVAAVTLALAVGLQGTALASTSGAILDVTTTSEVADVASPAASGLPAW